MKIEDSVKFKFSLMEERVSMISLGGAGQFLLFSGLLHILVPELDPTWSFISEYALSSYGWLLPLAFLSLAIGLTGTGFVLISYTGWIFFVNFHILKAKQILRSE